MTVKRFALVGPIGALVVVSSQAQTSPFTVRLGYSSYTNSSAGDATSTSGYTFGIGYDFYESKQTGMKLSVDADFDVHAGNGNNINLGSLFAVARVPFAKSVNGKGSGFYYGAGLGIVRSFVGFTQTSNPTGSSVITNSASNTIYVGGAEILLGTSITDNISAEVFYRFQGSNSGIQTNTIGVVLAVHF